jgi:hypothetical protein
MKEATASLRKGLLVDIPGVRVTEQVRSDLDLGHVQLAEDARQTERNPTREAVALRAFGLERSDRGDLMFSTLNRDSTPLVSLRVHA